MQHLVARGRIGSCQETLGALQLANLLVSDWKTKKNKKDVAGSDPDWNGVSYREGKQEAIEPVSLENSFFLPMPLIVVCWMVLHFRSWI
jgi:hypothetical protein